MKLAIWGNELTAWVTAGLLAKSGNNVFLVTEFIGEQRLEKLPAQVENEPGLKQLIEESHSKGYLNALSSEDAYTLDGHILSLNPSEFSTAQDVVRSVAATSKERLIINQSHFGIGKTDELQMLVEHNKHTVCYFAESLSEGDALDSVQRSTAVTLGLNKAELLPAIRSLLKPFCTRLDSLLVMKNSEAEFAKFSVTGMLALRLGYINELANLAEEFNVDINLIRQSMGADPRIGNHYLSPGCGFGGNTFSQTLKELSSLLVKRRNSELLDSVISANEAQKEKPFRTVWQHYQCDLRDLKIVIWGASFKPGTSAIDNAPSLKVIDALIAQQAKVYVHDPEALANLTALYENTPNVIPLEDKYKALQDADALLLLTEWPEYQSPDYTLMLKNMQQPIIIDGRNLYDRNYLESLGFTYYGIGH